MSVDEFSKFWDLKRDIQVDRVWDLYRQKITQDANIWMRDRFLGSDALVGSEILRRRRKGLSPQNMFILQQSWSPISWERSPGLSFEISEINMAAMGEDALDPEIDMMLVDAARAALADNYGGILEQVIQDLIHGDSENFEVVDE